MAADYFRPEGIDLFGTNKQTKKLSIAHLEKAIIAGKLDEEVINS
jgi:hypothetical protein